MKCKTNKVVVSYIVVNLPCVRVLFCERSFPGSIHRQAALYVCTGLGMSTTVGNNPNDSESIPLSLIRTGFERDKEREQGAQATICYSLLWLDVHPLEKPQATSAEERGNTWSRTQIHENKTVWLVDQSKKKRAAEPQGIYVLIGEI